MDIIEILNKDEKARILNEKFEKVAEQEGVTGEEYEELRKTFIGVMIFRNKGAFDQMVDEVYEQINARP